MSVLEEQVGESIILYGPSAETLLILFHIFMAYFYTIENLVMSNWLDETREYKCPGMLILPA